MNEQGSGTAIRTSGRRTIGKLLVGLAAVVMLFSLELINYFHATDYGMADEAPSVWQNFHPQCEPHTDGLPDFTCPLPGYNSIRMECWYAFCNPRDVNSPAMTYDRQFARHYISQQDKIASREAEPGPAPDHMPEAISDLQKVKQHKDEELGPPPKDLNFVFPYLQQKRRLELRSFPNQVAGHF